MLAAVIENELYIVFRQNYTEISRKDFLVIIKKGLEILIRSVFR